MKNYKVDKCLLLVVVGTIFAIGALLAKSLDKVSWTYILLSALAGGCLIMGVTIGVISTRRVRKLYLCDPYRNTKCTKTGCVHNPHAVEHVCAETFNKRFARTPNDFRYVVDRGKKHETHKV